MANYNTLWGARVWVGMRGSGGGGGGGGRRSGPHRKSHIIWVNLDLNPLPPLKKFPGSAHWGGGGGNLFHWHALIRTDRFPNGGPDSWGGGDSIPARGLGLAENDGFHVA